MPEAPVPPPPEFEPLGAPYLDPEAIRREAAKAGAKSMPFKPSTPTAEMAPYLGTDGVPVGISKFNWGALFLPQWWALAYGLTNWFLIGLAVVFIGNALVGFAPLPLVLLIALAQIGLSVYYGLNVNRAYWASNPKRLTIEQFRGKQAKWIVIGGVTFFLLNVLFPVVAFMSALSTAADL
jgi:hypothetical protein